MSLCSNLHVHMNIVFELTVVFLFQVIRKLFNIFAKPAVTTGFQISPAEGAVARHWAFTCQDAAEPKLTKKLVTGK